MAREDYRSASYEISQAMAAGWDRERSWTWEARRVLRDGGRLSLSVCGAAERNPWGYLPAKALMEHTGAPPANPEDPGIFAMADPERVRSLVHDAGRSRWSYRRPRARAATPRANRCALGTAQSRRRGDGAKLGGGT